MRYGDDGLLSHMVDGPLMRGVVIRQYVPPSAPTVVDTKQCYSCKQDKPVTAFYRRSGFRSGVMPSCMRCHSSIVQMRQRRAREDVKIREEETA